MCIDFTDLNKVSLKDDFPLPNVDILVYYTAAHALLSFTNKYIGYDQVKIIEEDMEKATFFTPWGTYCYTVMSFRLKPTGGTYQRIATALLHDVMHNEVEVYIEDMIIKSPRKEWTCYDPLQVHC